MIMNMINIDNKNIQCQKSFSHISQIRNKVSQASCRGQFMFFSKDTVCKVDILITIFHTDNTGTLD